VVGLLLVDEEPVFLLGLAEVLSDFPDVRILGHGGSVLESVAQAAQLQPDMALIEVSLPDGSGLDACRQILEASPQTKVVMLTSSQDPEAVVGSIVAGASGYLLKSAEPARLVEAIELIAGGSQVIAPEVAAHLLGVIRGNVGTSHGPLSGLTQQELRIASLVAEGQTNREIAASMRLSPHTVKTYVSGILAKLDLARRVDIARVFSAASDFAAQFKQPGPPRLPSRCG